jgi:hypothetical protein
MSRRTPDAVRPGAAGARSWASYGFPTLALSSKCLARSDKSAGLRMLSLAAVIAALVAYWRAIARRDGGVLR